MPTSPTMPISFQSPSHHGLRVTALALVCAALVGCGAEVAGTAAAVGALQVEQAKQAQAQQARIVEAMKAAEQAGVQRAADAASAAQ